MPWPFPDAGQVIATLSFKNVATGKFLARCYRCVIGIDNLCSAHATDNSAPSTRFTLISAGNYRVYLQADTGNYLTRTRGIQSFPDGDVAGIESKGSDLKMQWIMWDVGTYGSNTAFALQADTDKYLATCKTCFQGFTDGVVVNGTDPMADSAKWIVTIH